MFMVRIFMKCTHVCAAQKSLLTLYQIIKLIKPDFPSLADEIAEQHPDMNIKVAAFTVSEKSIVGTQSGQKGGRAIGGDSGRQSEGSKN